DELRMPQRRRDGDARAERHAADDCARYAEVAHECREVVRELLPAQRLAVDRRTGAAQIGCDHAEALRERRAEHPAQAIVREATEKQNDRIAAAACDRVQTRARATEPNVVEIDRHLVLLMERVVDAGADAETSNASPLGRRCVSMTRRRM